MESLWWIIFLQLKEKELDIRKLVAKELKRGKIELLIYSESIVVKVGGDYKIVNLTDFQKETNVSWPVAQKEYLEDKNEKKIGVASLLTKKIKLNDLLIFNDFSKEIKKTKEIFSLLNKFHAKNSIMILDKSSRNNILKATRNIPNVKCTDVNHFSAFDIIKYKKIIFTETSIKELEKRYT